MRYEKKSAEERWMERTRERTPLTPSRFPKDASAIIYQAGRCAMTSGKAREHEWKLRFEPRSPHYLEPLMGWTAGEDTLRQVELTFPTLASAVAYARKQGLEFIVQGATQADRTVSNIQDAERAQAARKAVRRTWRHEWIERTLGPEAVRHRSPLDWDLSLVYGSPQEVVDDPMLSTEQKREILRRWALDSYLTELALAKGETVDHPPRFEEAEDALLGVENSSACPCSSGMQVGQPAA